MENNSQFNNSKELNQQNPKENLSKMIHPVVSTAENQEKIAQTIGETIETLLPTKPMKGTYWNGDHFARKGMSRSESTSMFSVGNLVAFKSDYYCSPDSSYFSNGAAPTQENYLLQQEIELAEFNKTSSNQYGSGKNNHQVIVNLPNKFIHSVENQLSSTRYLLQVLPDSTNIFDTNFIQGSIKQVRNHPGLYLHIYEIPKNYEAAIGNSFEQTVSNIKQQKLQEENAQQLAIEKNYRGVNLEIGIISSEWYASSIQIGKINYTRVHEHDSTKTYNNTLLIAENVPNGQHIFYLSGYPVAIHLNEGDVPYINMLTEQKWNDNQNWWYQRIEQLTIKKGQFFVDGVDVYDSTKEIVEKNIANKKAKIKDNFLKTQESCLNLGYSDVQIEEIIALRKGKVIAGLKLAAELVNKCEFTPEQALEINRKAISLDPVAALNYAQLVKNKEIINGKKLHKAANNAGSWKYLSDLVPGISRTGKFDDAMAAVQLFKKGIEEVPTRNDGIVYTTSSEGTIDYRK